VVVMRRLRAWWRRRYMDGVAERLRKTYEEDR
jgi:hypothetical protein